MPKFGFIGPAYTGRTKIVAAEQCVNLYPEKIETAEAKTNLVLIGTPGLSVFANLAALPAGIGVRGIWRDPFTGRVFAVASNVFYELASNGVVTARGTFAEPTGLNSPVSMRSSRTQMVIASNGNGYLFTLATNTFLQLNGVNFPFVSQNQPGAAAFPVVTQFEFFDTYFVAQEANSESAFVSFQNDGTNWAALNNFAASSWPDNTVAMLMNKRELWLMGSQRGEVWWDAGNPGGVPFQRIEAAAVEVGCEAEFSFARGDSGMAWLGGDERGGGMAFRTNGYDAARISNHGVEFEWSAYSTRTDAEAFVYEDNGHTFWHCWFPTGDATWVYDYSTGMWHRRQYLDPNTGLLHAALPRCHAFAFGQHLVGDRQSGNIYAMSLNTFTDNGAAIRRVRSCSVFQERKWMYYQGLDIYALTGQADGVQGPGTEPIAYLRISDDGGFTFGNPIDAPLGFTAQYGYRWQWRHLGRSRDRVFEFSTSEPIPIALVDAYLSASPGSGA